MSDYTVKILLTAKDEASGAVKNLARELTTLGVTGAGGAEVASTGFKKFTEDLREVYDQWTAAYGILQSAWNKMSDLYELGVQSADARRVLTSLTGSAQEAAAAIEQMQRATNGVVSSLDLMQGANRFLTTGVATTTEDVTRVTELAVKLGQAMGLDAAKAIDSFATMLTNRSIERLDSFGIASDKVRMRVNELKKEGVLFQEAFNMATLEEATKTLERLGDSAVSVGAPIDIVKSKLSDLQAQLAENYSTGVYSLGGILLYLTGNYPGQQEAIVSRTNTNADIAKPIIDLVEQGLGAADTSYLKTMILEGLNALAKDPELINDSSELGIRVVEAMNNRGLWDFSVWGKLSDAMPSGEALGPTGNLMQFGYILASSYSKVLKDTEDAAAAAERLAGEQDRIAAGAQRIADENAKAAAARAEELRTLQIVGRESDAAFALTQKQNDAMPSFHKMIWNELSNLYSLNPIFRFQLESIKDTYSFFGKTLDSIDWFMPTYMKQYEAKNLRIVADTLSTDLDLLKKVNETALVPIGDEELATMQTMVDNANAIADAGQRAADAYASIKLSDLFGQTGGGILGQMTDSITAYMESIGKTDKEIQAMKDALDLASGRQTPGSQFYDQNVIPALAGLAPADAVRVSQAYDEMMRLAALKDLSPDQIAGLQQEFMSRLFVGQNPLQMTVTPYGVGGAGAGQPYTLSSMGTDMSEMFKKQFNITLPSSAFSALDTLGAIDPNLVKEQITKEMLKVFKDARPFINADTIKDSPDFQKAVADAVSMFLTPLQGGGGGTMKVSAGGDPMTSTVHGLALTYHTTDEAIMRAAGITNPRDLQPGTYNAGFGGVNMSMLNTFDPFSFLMSYLTGGTTATGADMMGTLGTAGFGAGMFANGGMVGSGDGQGMSLIDTLAEAADASQPLVDNTTQIAENVKQANDILTTLANNVTVVKILLDVDAGIFKELLTRMGIDVTGTSTRDNGGRVRGADRRVMPEPR